jgi:hypothetical protein
LLFSGNTDGRIDQRTMANVVGSNTVHRSPLANNSSLKMETLVLPNVLIDQIFSLQKKLDSKFNGALKVEVIVAALLPLWGGDFKAKSKCPLSLSFLFLILLIYFSLIEFHSF